MGLKEVEELESKRGLQIEFLMPVGVFEVSVDLTRGFLLKLTASQLNVRNLTLLVGLVRVNLLRLHYIHLE